MATKKNEVVEIRPVEIETVKIRIVGDTPLIVHNWSEKAKRMMLEAQQRTTRTKPKHDIRRPFEDFVESLYWLTEKPVADNDEELAEKYEEAVKNGAKFGIPCSAIKQAANSDAYRKGWFSNQMALRGAYFIKGTDNPDFVTICGDAPIMREDMVTVGNGGTDLRYRAEFKNWYADLNLAYDKNGTISLEQILNCIEAGGFSVGIMEWRPEKDGTYGMFHVERMKK